MRPVLATVSYNEAGRLMDGGERVDTVAMPAAIADWLRPFVATHYKPQPRGKVKRNDPTKVWEGHSFCRTKEALLRCSGHRDHPALLALPERCS